MEENKKRNEYLDNLGISYNYDEKTGYLGIDLNYDLQDTVKHLDEHILRPLGIFPSNFEQGEIYSSDFLLHGTNQINNGQSLEDASQIAKSYFESGLKGSKAGSENVLGTASLQKNNSSYGEKLINYQGMGSTVVLINIPPYINELEFGKVDRNLTIGGRCIEEATANLDIGNALSIDYLQLGLIPKEFIVGILYRTKPQQERFSFEDTLQTKLILNPNYIANTNHRQTLPDGTQISNYEALKNIVENAPGYNKFLEVTKQQEQEDFKRYSELLPDEFLPE